MHFDTVVAQGGYAWWYVDALSDDGRLGITLIAFIGSVFSPYYAHARRRGAGDPYDHCALNVAIYGAGGRWAMTERRRGSVVCEPQTLAIGPSAVRWSGDALTIDIDELAVPRMSRIRGQVRVFPTAVFGTAYALDAAAVHHWRPIAPCAQVEVALDHPSLRWRGHGYFDTNRGDAPLEDSFSGWHWSRARMNNGAAVLYDVREVDGASQSLALRFGHDGVCQPMQAPLPATLPGTRWGIARETRSEADAAVLQTLEDTPFYARSLVSTRVEGDTVSAVHESLSLERFRSRWVQALLPFRMPRAFR